MCRCNNCAANYMKKNLFLLFLSIMSPYLWSQNDPYSKLVSIPTDMEKQAQAFLLSTCDSIQFKWEKVHSDEHKDGNFVFIIPLKYTYKKDIPYTVDDVESYTKEVPYTHTNTRGDDYTYYKTVTEQRVYKIIRHDSIVEPTNEMILVKKKLVYQKKYNSSKLTISKYQGFDDTHFQDSVKNEINSKYSNEAYKKYIRNKGNELKQLIKEWESVPLTEVDIKAQTNRVRSSWKNFDQMKTAELMEFNSKCFELLEAKRFVYKYEHDIP